MSTLSDARHGAPETASAAGPVRPPAVAGSFYPARTDRLRGLIDALLEEAGRQAGSGAVDESARALGPRGLLLPHAGLDYSGLVAAAGWRLLPSEVATVVLLGTNHGAAWLDGIGVWEAGTWRTPLGGTPVDEDLAAAIVDLGRPFGIDRAAHLGEHSIEVQLPVLQTLLPEARIVPLAVAAGTGPGAVAAGEALGELLARRRAGGERLLLAISSDMAHYPGADDAARVTATLLPHILEVDARTLSWIDRAVAETGIPGLVCGMCGIEPAVVGLAALRAMGCGRGIPVARATSADAGGPADRTVGYLAVAF
jgi:hypothetical protein